MDSHLDQYKGILVVVFKFVCHLGEIPVPVDMASCRLLIT